MGPLRVLLIESAIGIAVLVIVATLIGVGLGVL